MKGNYSVEYKLEYEVYYDDYGWSPDYDWHTVEIRDIEKEDIPEYLQTHCRRVPASMMNQQVRITGVEVDMDRDVTDLDAQDEENNDKE